MRIGWVIRLWNDINFFFKHSVCICVCVFTNDDYVHFIIGSLYIYINLNTGETLIHMLPVGYGFFVSIAMNYWTTSA